MNITTTTTTITTTIVTATSQPTTIIVTSNICMRTMRLQAWSATVESSTMHALWNHP